jgi:hypothetical protein
MINIGAYILRLAKGLYGKLNPESSSFGRNWRMFPVKEYSNKMIYDLLINTEPVMIARLGSTELTCMVNYLGVKKKRENRSAKRYIQGQGPAWWWNKKILQQMSTHAGFFPAEIIQIEAFCEMMISGLSDVDVLGSWLKEEKFFELELAKSKKVMLEDLEPFFAELPWTWALQGKKVLVVHPFAEQIESQYLIRDKLFGYELLPSFDLITIKAVQSIAGESTSYETWFEALDSMKRQISEIDFEVCILGCGAYGFPLASYVKNLGKKSIHLGGVTQLLFGIKGARWENYVVYPYTNLFNSYWVRPNDNVRPRTAELVEGGCYW